MSEQKKKNYFKFVIVLITVLAVIYLFIVIFSIFIVKHYEEFVYPNTYINEYDISNKNRKELKTYLTSIEDKVLSQKIKFLINNNEYVYTIKEIGISLDKTKIINEIFQKQEKFDYNKKIYHIVNGSDTNTFTLKYLYTQEILDKFLEKLKVEVNIEDNTSGLVMDNNRNLSYKFSDKAFTLDIDKSYEILTNTINNSFSTDVVELPGMVINAVTDPLSTIDTKVSSFSTKFNQYISRGTNVKAGAQFIDGVILYPNEEFSFFNYAGPYNKKGYVYYDKMIGNGVCQVSSTIYNTALLGGLEILERNKHDHKVPYVLGGLDAMVASFGNKSGSNLRFKNTYQYPIYISAYTSNGVLTIDFWSNSNAKNGNTYETESVFLGGRRYQTYLKIYQNGVLVDKKFIAETNYPKES